MGYSPLEAISLSTENQEAIGKICADKPGVAEDLQATVQIFEHPLSRAVRASTIASSTQKGRDTYDGSFAAVPLRRFLT